MREYRLAAMTHPPARSADMNRYLVSFCALVADKLASLGADATEAGAEVLGEMRREMLALAAMGKDNPIASYAWTHGLEERDEETSEHRLVF